MEKCITFVKNSITMPTTKNFSIRTRTDHLAEFDRVLSIQKLSRSSVIEDFMVSYVQAFDEKNTPSSLRLTSSLAKFRGKGRLVEEQEVADDPRARHILGYE